MRRSAAALALAMAACGSGGSSQASRDFVRAVGSSTVYPFATAVAEQSAKASGGDRYVSSTAA